MDLPRPIRNLVTHTRQFGPAATFHELQSRALNTVFDFKILRGMTAVIDDVPPEMLHAPGYQARFADRDELLTATEDPDVLCEMSPDFVERALAKGDECFGLFDGERLASFGWYSTQPTRIGDDLTLHFDPNWVYMYKGYTLPDYRGQRLHGIGMSLALKACTERGKLGLISYVRSTNVRSLRSIERMGYRIFGDVYIVRSGDRTWSWASPGCRPYDFQVATRSAIAA